MNRRWITGAMILAALGTAAAAAAAEIWRAGQRPVLEPAEEVRETPSNPVARFRSRYQEAGSPAVMVLWNQQLREKIRTQQEERETLTVRESGNGVRVVRARREGSTSAGTRPYFSSLSRRDGAALEQGFRQRLRRAGVSVVDRTLSIRTTSAEKHRDGADARLVEADALMGKAQLLMEVVPVPDDDSPLGIGFQVTVQDIHSARELASLYTLAEPEAPTPAGRYVAAEGGFVWHQPQVEPSAQDAGSALADAVMEELLRAWEPAQP